MNDFAQPGSAEVETLARLQSVARPGDDAVMRRDMRKEHSRQRYNVRLHHLAWSSATCRRRRRRDSHRELPGQHKRRRRMVVR